MLEVISLFLKGVPVLKWFEPLLTNKYFWMLLAFVLGLHFYGSAKYDEGYSKRGEEVVTEIAKANETDNQAIKDALKTAYETGLKEEKKAWDEQRQKDIDDAIVRDRLHRKFEGIRNDIPTISVAQCSSVGPDAYGLYNNTIAAFNGLITTGGAEGTDHSP